jgi:hypothetical protein
VMSAVAVWFCRALGPLLLLAAWQAAE